MPGVPGEPGEPGEPGGEGEPPGLGEPEGGLGGGWDWPLVEGDWQPAISTNAPISRAEPIFRADVDMGVSQLAIVAAQP